MEQYVGLDVSLKETEICVMDGRAAVLARDRVPTQLARALGTLAPAASVVVLETGGQSRWLHQELTLRAVPAVIVEIKEIKGTRQLTRPLYARDFTNF